MLLTKFASNIENLYVNIYLIGYKTAGESIIFFIKDENKVIFSALIDCYHESSLNKSIEILQSNNVTNLNLVCWSHPDEDHTKGLYSIMENCCIDTIYITPYKVIDQLRNSKKKHHQQICNVIDNTHLLRKEENRHYTITVNPQGYNCIGDVTFKDTLDRKLKLNIYSLSPISCKLDYYQVNDSGHSNNKYSIALLFSLSNINFLFSSDIENDTIQQMHLDSIRDIFYLKNPHHTSKRSDLLYEYYKSNQIEIPLSVTTIYKQHDLPDPDTIQKYKDVFKHLYCTNTNNHNNKEDKFGCIEYLARLTDDKAVENIENNIHLHGLAEN